MDDKCRYCGTIHGPTCPTIKAIEYYENGIVKRVEFKTNADYMPQTVCRPYQVTWPLLASTMQGEVS